MAKVLVVYHSKTGNTEKMAQLVADGAEAAGADVKLRTPDDTTLEDLQEADAILLGSPTYYGHSAAAMRALLERSVRLHGKLEGKVGGAFSSSHNIGGGNETTVLDLIHALLIHGMIVQGFADGDHYGPVSIGAPDERVSEQARRFGEKNARLAAKLTGS